MWTAVLCALGSMTQTVSAEGWPANFHGVMLQGFWWDSFKASPTNTKWSTMTANCDELSTYFNLIWVPNSAKAASQGNGYDPVYWFTNHNTPMGTEAQIRNMIAAYKAKGTGIIEDVVINHRSGKSNWTDFPEEVWNGQTWKIGPEGICCNDEVASASGQATPTGAPDTGENFDGSRDLDHTNANVQNNCKNYCKFLLTDMGYAGFRLDMTKGYGGQYTKIYNQYAKPKFCVGEYWDGSYDALAAWIEATGKESAAFDFAFKYAVNEAFSSGDYTKLVWMANGNNPQPAGLIHFGYPQYAVTFIDNHDTSRDDWNKFKGNVVAANAFMLCSPGTPCVFYPHYLDNKAAIQRLIAIRNSVGVSNTSTVNVLRTDGSCYMAEVTGSKGKLVVKVGPAMASPSGYSDSDIKASGTDYCVWTKVAITNNHGDNIDGTTSNPGTDPVNPGTAFTVYFDNSSAKWATPYIHYWGGESESAWPGVAMQKVKDNIWKYTVPAGTSGILFNAGDGDASKTGDFTAVADHVYTQAGDQGQYNGGGGGGDTPNPSADFKVYFDNGPTGWTTPHIYYWGASAPAWPGVAMQKFKDNVWVYTVPEGTTGVIFNAGDGDATKTTDLVAQPNHIYSKPDGDKGVYDGASGGGDTPNPPTPGSYPAKIYMVGTINGTPWATSTGLEPSTADTSIGKYVWNAVTVDASSSDWPKGYFTFLTALDAVDGEWDGANQGDRYGAPAKDEPLVKGGFAAVAYYQYMVNAIAAESWEVAPGEYSVVLDLASMTVSLGEPGQITDPIDPPTPPTPGNYPDPLYLVGNVNGNAWGSAHGIVPTSKDLTNGVYTWEGIVVDPAAQGETVGYFTFLTALDAVDGEWDGANQGDRYGAAAENSPLSVGGSDDIVLYKYMVDAMAAQSWMVNVGTYNLVADLKNMKVNLSDLSGIEEVTLIDGAAEYYDLTGRRVLNPTTGIFIVKRGNTVTKHYLR